MSCSPAFPPARRRPAARLAFRTWTAAAAGLGLLGAGFAGPASAGSPKAQTTADAILEDALKAGPYPGVIVAVERRGKLVYSRAVGVADLETKRPMTFETRLPIGSITKSFTCLSTLQLAAAGKIDLDRPVGAYVADLPQPSRDVPVRNLMNHTGGVVSYLSVKGFPYDQTMNITRRDVVGFFGDKPLMFEPGTAFSYSNSGTYLLGLAIEGVTGETYDSYVETNVFKPFGMTHSGFDVDDVAAPDRARGYRRGPQGLMPAVRYGMLAPFSAGAIVSTAGDLLKYRRGVFGPKTSPAVRELFLTRDKLKDGTSVPYMLGCMAETDLDGRRKYSHAGDIYGFASHLAYYPDADITVVVLTNNQSGSFPPVTIERKVARAFLGLPQQVRQALPLTEADAAAYVGDYRVGAIKFGPETLGFVYKDGQLNLSFGGQKSGARLVPLRNQGGGVFASPVDDEQLFRFGADGRLTMRAYDGAFIATKVP